MSIMILRRRRLGMGSVRGLKHHSDGRMDWVRNDRLSTKDWNNITHVVRWGCTSSIPEVNNDVKILNKASAIHATTNKAEFRRTFQIEYPESSIESFGRDWGTLVLPCVVRPSTHSRGLHMALCHNNSDVVEAFTRFGPGSYGGKLIEKVDEYRVYVVGGRAVAVAKKVVEDKTTLAWNRAQGDCEFVNVRWDNWPLRVVEAGIDATNHLGLDFGGADVMVDENGRPYILEVNSAPSLPLHERNAESTLRRNSEEDIAERATYRQKCFAKGLLHTIDNGHSSPILEVNGWRDVIHPGVWSRS